ARADAKGDAITLVSYHDKRYLEPIRKSMGDQLVVLDVPQDLNPNRRPQRDEQAAPRERFESRTNKPAPPADKPIVDKTASVVESTDKPSDDTSDKKPAPRRNSRRPAKKKTDSAAPEEGAPVIDTQENAGQEPDKVVKPQTRRATRKAKPAGTADSSPEIRKAQSDNTKSDDEVKPDSTDDTSADGDAQVKR